MSHPLFHALQSLFNDSNESPERSRTRYDRGFGNRELNRSQFGARFAAPSFGQPREPEPTGCGCG